MSAERATVVVIGAGVVGCAVGHELSLRGLAPIILEKGPRIAEGTTSRNSGVIHAGIYYPPGSLKAESCIRGKELLYEWCAKYGVPHRKTGKWIVGSRSEEEDLSETLDNALKSGAKGVEWGKPEDLNRLTGISAEVGLFSRETGIIDPYEYSLSFKKAAEEKGAQFLFNADVLGITRLPQGGYQLETSRGEIETDAVVNSAGLYADKIAEMVGVNKYKIYPWRGDYFRLKTNTRYDHLIYPVKKKSAPGLGVHLTLGLDGSYRLGPDVFFSESKEDFSPPLRLEEKRQAFFDSASKYLKDLKLENLEYDFCGLRPKLRAPQDSGEKDFVLSEDLPSFINLIGIESPGLTAARDLAQRVTKLL